MDAGHIAIVAGAALAGGAINAVAGGGSLITFPALVAAGLPPVLASATNTVAMCPGYLGATLAQRKDLAGQGRRAGMLLPAGAAGGAAGAWLLMHTSARAFDVIVPFFILAAALLLALQEPLRRRLLRGVSAGRAESLAVLPIAAAAIYGGYFGAGVGVMMLAALGVIVGDSLLRLNALKQALTLTVNVTAALAFIWWGAVDWTLTLVMAGTALAGGAIGGVIAARIPQRALRWTVVTIGIGVAAVYFTRI